MSSCISVGSLAGASSWGLASSLAAITGGLAGQPTLLVDLSPECESNRKAWGWDDPHGVEPLIAQFIRTRAVDWVELRAQVVQYERPDLGMRAFGLLAGPAQVTPRYSEQLLAHRGRLFCGCVLEAIQNLKYSHVIVNLGEAWSTVRGRAIIDQSVVHLVVAPAGFNYQSWLEEKRATALAFARKTFSFEDGPYAFPDKEFLDSIERRQQKYRGAISRQALAVIRALDATLAEGLRNAEGKPIKPADTSVVQRLLGR